MYIRFGGFGLSAHLYDGSLSSDTTSFYYAYQKEVRRVWQYWFDGIQQYHAAGNLGGVIIDVRNNGGGYVNDYKFALGALLPSGGWESHTMRVKNGSGRLDFGPLVPFIVKTYPEEHAVIDQRPIVVLANSRSVSMAENTTWGVKSQPNGCFIGTRTFGGLSALNTSTTDYSAVYSGAFGVQGSTPIYGYVPKYVCLYPQADGSLRPLESYGFEPDIDLPLDVKLWRSSQRDNQLEAAIDYIRSK
jgi:C-terminal processing protease CtpA/Prc